MNWHAAALSALLVVRDWFLNPLMYAGFLLAFWDLRRTSAFERKFFGIRSTRPLRRTIIRGLQGLIAGIVVSALLFACGVVVDLWEVAAVTGVGIILAAVQLRFVSPVYSVGLLSLASFVVSRFVPKQQGWMGVVLGHLGQFHTVGWMGVVTGVLLAEAALVFFAGRRTASPMVTVSKRGRSIGALWVQLAFMVPLIIPTTGDLWRVPAYAHTSLHILWTSSIAGISILGLPVLVGFSGLFDNMRPRAAVRQTAVTDLVSAVFTGAGAYLGLLYGVQYATLAPWVVIVTRELSRWWLDRRQSSADPLFAHGEEGVVVLSVLPDSWAARLDVKPLDTITKVNGVPVHSQYDLHFALNQNPAYAKLDVVDERGEIRFVSHTVYEGERAQLGLIFAPDGQTPRFIKARGSGLLQSLYARLVNSTGSTGITASGPSDTTSADLEEKSTRTSVFSEASGTLAAQEASTTKE